MGSVLQRLEYFSRCERHSVRQGTLGGDSRTKAHGKVSEVMSGRDRLKSKAPGSLKIFPKRFCGFISLLFHSTLPQHSLF